MPQLQTGQVDPNDVTAPSLYGLDKIENAIPFQERLMRLFKPQEFVIIKNITDEPLFWQYMPSDNEQESFSEDGMQRIITRSAPEMWKLDPGQQEAIVGISAYRALDVMYKNYAAASTLRKFSDPTSPLYNEDGKHIAKNFNFSDGGAQDAFIKKAYIGKATPTFDGQTNVVEAPTVAPAIQPMQAEPQVVLTSKSTVGAPLEAPEYADPSNTNLRTAAELKNASSSKK